MVQTDRRVADMTGFFGHAHRVVVVSYCFTFTAD